MLILKCKRCPHLQACTEYYIRDLYGAECFDRALFGMRPISEADMIEEFLKEAKKHKCTRLHRKTMDLIDPKINKRQ